MQICFNLLFDEFLKQFEHRRRQLLPTLSTTTSQWYSRDHREALPTAALQIVVELLKN